jgi:glycosyltransferase involved in cell wall biosynthesis
MKKFIVAHNGARHNYAIPYFFAQAGLLEYFYTDICGNVGFGKNFSQGKDLPFIGEPLSRLAGRKVPLEVIPYTHTFAIPYFKSLWRSLILPKDEGTRFYINCLRTIESGNAMINHGFGDATHIYSMLGEFAPLLIAANERGIKIASDVYIMLSTDKILEEERKEFPDWEESPPNYEKVSKKLFPEKVLLTRTDLFVCPSEAVQADLIVNYGVSPPKTVVVPYGVKPDWLELKPQPIPQRILFVGSANLRKGIHYLAMAAQQLHQQGYDYEFRVAGDVTPEIRNKPICKHLTFLGRIPRNEIQAEFIKADIFVLPSLAEGSAGVTYEALATGLPIVTTKSSGSVVENGIQGYVIPEKDPSALANAIVSIVEDRSKRDQMAIAAREKAREFTWDKYQKRLIETLNMMD